MIKLQRHEYESPPLNRFEFFVNKNLKSGSSKRILSSLLDQLRKVLSLCNSLHIFILVYVTKYAKFVENFEKKILKDEKFLKINQTLFLDQNRDGL